MGRQPKRSQEDLARHFSSRRVTQFEHLLAGCDRRHSRWLSQLQLPQNVFGQARLALADAIFVEGQRPPAPLQHLPDCVQENLQELCRQFPFEKPYCGL